MILHTFILLGTIATWDGAYVAASSLAPQSTSTPAVMVKVMPKNLNGPTWGTVQVPTGSVIAGDPVMT